MRRRLALTATALAAALTLTACGGDPLADEDGTGTTGTVVVGGANFTEMLIMQAMYVELLEDAGFDTRTITADQREIYFPELADGAIGVVPEYAATLAEHLNVAANGSDAAPVATSDADETVRALRPLAQAQGVQILEPARAASQNAFAVTEQLAEANGLRTLSDLGALGQDVVLAAGEECSERPFCGPGLTATYGIRITEIMPTGFSSPQTKQAVQSGQAQLGLVGSTDATVAQFGLVVLEDDRDLQLADNLVPAVNADLAEDDALVEALNRLADVLTTEDLADLNAQVDAERRQAADVARDYLRSKSLID